MRRLDPPAPAPAHRLALRHADPAHQLERRIGHGEQLLHRVGAVVDAAHAGVPGAEDDARDARLLDRPAAHRARLHRGVQRRAGEVARPEPARSVADRLDLGVGGRVGAGGGAVLSLADDRAVAYDNAGDRAVPTDERLLAAREDGVHEAFVLGTDRIVATARSYTACGSSSSIPTSRRASRT